MYVILQPGKLDSLLFELVNTSIASITVYICYIIKKVHGNYSVQPEKFIDVDTNGYYQFCFRITAVVITNCRNKILNTTYLLNLTLLFLF